jgi:hypothetical protein
MPKLQYSIRLLNSFDYEILTFFCSEFCKYELQINKKQGVAMEGRNQQFDHLQNVADLYAQLTTIAYHNIAAH